MLRVLALSRICSSRAMASSKRFIGDDEPTPIAYTRAVRAVDLHVHLPLPEWVEGGLGPYREATGLLPPPVTLSTAEELAGAYEALDTIEVLLAWDAETATAARPSTTSSPGSWPGSRAGSSVSPRWARETTALAELRRAREELGLHGFKFHPSMQAFRPDDARFAELFEQAAALPGAVPVPR